MAFWGWSLHASEMGRRNRVTNRRSLDLWYIIPYAVVNKVLTANDDSMVLTPHEGITF
jgi:hypothetical protein